MKKYEINNYKYRRNYNNKDNYKNKENKNYKSNFQNNYDESNNFYMYKYDGELREMLLKYKFEDKSYLYKFFADQITKNNDAINFIKKFDIIIPVPLHRKRFLERGYNQSQIVMKSLVINNKHVNNVENNILKKNVNLKPQSIKGVEDRLRDVKGAFYVNPKQAFKIQNKSVLLFDDIYTTGATANECKKVLINAGANEVGVLTLARD